MDIFDKDTRRTGIKLSLYALGILLIVFFLAYFVGSRVFAWKYTWYSFAAVIVIVGSMLLYFPYRKKKRRRLEDEFDDELKQIAIQKANKENELDRTSLKMHVSGHCLTKLFELQTVVTVKLHAAKSFLSNLKVWYREESETIKLLDADTQLPFVTL